MIDWDWPGNIRELQNFIERAVILTKRDTLNVPVSELRSARPRKVQTVSTIEDAERNAIVAALRAAKGRISGMGGAADCLGMKRTTLQNRMRRLGVSRKDCV
jgi:formate hydrogenlyase transcriptional activator